MNVVVVDVISPNYVINSASSRPSRRPTWKRFVACMCVWSQNYEYAWLMTDECEITAQQIVAFVLINDNVIRERWNTLYGGMVLRARLHEFGDSQAIFSFAHIRPLGAIARDNISIGSTNWNEWTQKHDLFNLVWGLLCTRQPLFHHLCRVSEQGECTSVHDSTIDYYSHCNSSGALQSYSCVNFAWRIYFSRAAIVSAKNSNETKKRCPNIQPFSATKNVIPLYRSIKADDVHNAIHFVAQKQTEQWIVCGARGMMLSRKNSSFWLLSKSLNTWPITAIACSAKVYRKILYKIAVSQVPAKTVELQFIWGSCAGNSSKSKCSFVIKMRIKLITHFCEWYFPLGVSTSIECAVASLCTSLFAIPLSTTCECYSRRIRTFSKFIAAIYD